MKLYYKPGACSLASHIALRESEADFEIEKVDTKIQKTETGDDFQKINIKGVVPVLKLEDGQFLTEGPAILQYIADKHPRAGLAAEPGTLERARINEHLTYVSSELHPAFAPLFSASATDEQKKAARNKVGLKLDYINKLLSDGRDYLVANSFSIADAYLFTASSWCGFVGIDMSKWSDLSSYVNRVSSREKVQIALKAEGLA
ncbi:MAG: glutathione transferase GstA [Cohaesibacteraceae bacterium]|nr:glutathione transferase GstA [Cohaesibacteraceae bacterium]